MIKRIKPYWWQLRLFGWEFDITFYPVKAKEEYHDLGPKIYYARGKPEQMDLIVKQAQLADKYHFL